MLNHPGLPLFVAPTSMEYQAIRKGLTDYLPNNRVKLNLCGVGEIKSREFSRQLDPGSVGCLVLLGWAGGLVSDLPVGAIIIATMALKEGYPHLPCATLSLTGAREGHMLTSPVTLQTPLEKNNAQKSGCLAVEMEAYPLAEWAAQHGIPFYHARVILDGLNDTLPDLGLDMDANGKLHLGQFPRKLFRHPSLIFDLWRLYRHVNDTNPVLSHMAKNVASQLC